MASGDVDKSGISPFEDVYEVKKAAITSKLQKREDDRLESISQKREVKESTAQKEENTSLFFENFQKAKTQIANGLTNSETIPKADLAEHLSQVAKDLDALCKYLTESTIYLPSYDVQKSQSIIGELQDELQKAQDKYLPKKKFAFKARSKASSKSDDDKEKMKIPAKEKRSYNIEINEIAIKEKLNETIVKSDSDVNDKDIVLSKLTNCTIRLEGTGSSMQIDGLMNCKVICGPVSRSIFINNCSNCTFILACQQLRIHHTNNTSFYIHVTTKAIIEDTSDVKFGKYCVKYPGFDDHWVKSGLDVNKNNWDDVDDFNYLASDARSPNWRIATPEEQSAIESIVVHD